MPDLFFPEKSASPLGHLETMVMQLLWDQGENSVRDVLQRLHRPLAYTTVMTTLDRLFKKGLLSRRKRDRAFFYSPRMTAEQFERRRVDELLDGLLARPHPSGDPLISCLVEAVGERDEALLAELERKIKLKRQELDRKEAL